MNDNMNKNEEATNNEMNNVEELPSENSADIQNNDQTNTSYETTADVREEKSDYSLEDALTNGIHSALYKRISNITINDIRIRDAFSKFLKDIECDKSLSVAEIIYSTEAILKNGEPSEEAGNIIFCIDYIPLIKIPSFTKLFKNSVAGIYTLFTLHSGIAIDIDAIGGSIATAETRRFIIIPSKKADKVVALCQANGIKISKAGQLISSEQIILTKGNEILSTVDKSIIGNNSASTSVILGQGHIEAFKSGYNAVCSLMLCNCISQNNILRFGLGGDLSDVLARALGYYSAAMFLKAMPIRLVYSAENDATVAVSRPKVADGDYLYLLKVRDGVDGLPDKAHLAQLYQYMREKKRVGIIKDVLPVRENIQGLINRLSNDALEYVSIANVPEKCFGIIVSVGRGESVNGIKLGYFKNI